MSYLSKICTEQYTEEPILIKVLDVQTEEWKDGHTLFYRTLLAAGSGPIKSIFQLLKGYHLVKKKEK